MTGGMDHPDTDLGEFHDRLTGLPSAQVWADALAWAIERAGRRSPQPPVTVAQLELGGLDALSDSDPQAAARLLKSVGAAWHDLLEDSGLVARLFDGRFGVLLPDRSLERALEVVADLRERVPAGHAVSVGLAVWEGEDPERLASRADGALAGAKLHGRDRAAVAC